MMILIRFLNLDVYNASVAELAFGIEHGGTSVQINDLLFGKRRQHDEFRIAQKDS